MSDLLNQASLVYIPSGYKEDTAYTVIPTNGNGDLTFTRASDGTRVNSQGLVERVPWNLLTYSNTFSNAAWSKNSATVTSGQSGYDGSSNAWKLEATSTDPYIYEGSFSILRTQSIYAKAGSTSKFSIIVGGYGNGMQFDLSNGTIVTNSNSSYFSGSITSVGNGWYNIVLTAQASAPTYGFLVAPQNLSGGGISIGDYVYIQDAQLNEGSTAKPYFPTTDRQNVPRLDYSNGCPSLLLEPQRTNSITYSEYIGAWTPNGLTITDNNLISPQGVLNAAKLTLPIGSATKRIALGSMPVTAIARSYSFFVKSDDITAVQLVHSGDLQGYARFDISTGSVGSTGSKTTAAIEDYGNGWYRCIANFDSTNTFGSTIYLYISDSATGGYGGSTSAQGDLFVYGAQYEEGSYATSYIKTSGTSVTRVADFSSNSDLLSSPILFGASDDFTLFYEGSFNDLASNKNMIMGGGASSGGASYKSYWWVYPNAGTIRITGEGEVAMANASVTLSNNTNYKLLVRRDGTVIDFFVNGTKLTTTQNTTNTPFAIRSIGWSYNNTVYKVSGNIKQVVVFPSALTDSEATAITT